MSFDYDLDFLFGIEHGITPVVETWGDLSYDRDVARDGVALLLEQFSKSENLKALVAILLNQIQDLEGAAWQLLTERNIEYATGAQLDGLGAIVGETRAGREDELYRVAIRVRIAVNRSNGRVEDLINILALLFGDELSVWPREHSIAAMTMELRNPALTPNTPGVLIGFLRDAKAAGVGFDLGYTEVTHAETLVFGDYEGSTVIGGGMDDYEGQDVDAGAVAGVIW